MAAPGISVHLLPSLIPPGALAGGVAVAIDALRATTVMARALASGCLSVVPCLEIEDARAAAASFPPGGAILGGERGGLPIPGFDLGNSPREYTPGRCSGKVLVMTTTNGTRAIHAATAADRVLIAAFANRAAVAEALKDEDRPIHLIAAGTEGFISLEDTLVAGALADALAGRFRLANDEAVIAASAWRDAAGPGAPDPARLAARLREGRGGRNVEAIGLGPDIDEVAEVDSLPLVAEWDRARSRIIRA